ncbi:MAG TPA: hypothetical protein VGF95_09380 [Solirubrobacteraceae bacterium]|jgi:hypothetical protein
MSRRGLATLAATAAAAFAALGAAPALAASGPSLELEMHHAPTNIAPGDKGQLWLNLNNVGSGPTTGRLELTVDLPTGMTSIGAIEDVSFDFYGHESLGWSCAGESGGSTVECESSAGSIPAHSLNYLILEVKVNAGVAEGSALSASATLAGGSAVASSSAEESVTVSSAAAGFGVEAQSFTPGFFAADGVTSERQAGAHPELLTVGVGFNSAATGRSDNESVPIDYPSADLRDLSVELPPGFIGNPTAVGECAPTQLMAEACPSASQVGRFDGTLTPVGGGTLWNFTTGVFNMAHPRGEVTDLAFMLDGQAVHVEATLDPAHNYAITTTLPNVNETEPPFSGKVTIWGDPAASSHDSQRCESFSSYGHGDTGESCATDNEPKAFLTIPAQCETPETFRLSGYDSWEEPGIFGEEVDYTTPWALTGCEDLRFEPEVQLEPTGRQANTPTGLEVTLHVPQNENPNGLATPPVKDTTAILPEGMTFSPSFANGLQSCTLAQVKLGSDEPVQCPDASRIGEVTLRTPLLPNLLEGSLYLAAQDDNPFSSTFAMYLVIHDTEERGVLLKIPGKIETNPSTGQITTTFTETPQLPFEDLTLKFRSGSGAPLVSPPTCGAKAISVDISSWAQPDNPIELSNSYEVSEGPGGSACPPSASGRPFAPKLTAGTADPPAGAYSPFTLRLTREDSEQEISNLSFTLPPGLTGKIAGVPQCSDAAIAEAEAKGRTGAQEIASPSCPASSLLGSATIGVGVGPTLTWVTGKVYFAGPYKGAPFSIVAITPAVVGPYDFGVVLVRSALQIDPLTAQVKVVTDQLPRILEGVPVRLRDLRVKIERPEFIINPTSCEEMQISGQASSFEGASSPISQRFQAANCASLAFKPSFAVATSAKTSRKDGASLHVKLTYPKAAQGTEANVREVRVELPKVLPSRLNTLQHACTSAQFEANPAGCPSESVVGHAQAVTPVVPVPLEGPAYFVSNGSAKFPELVLVLQGDGITIDLHGETFISKQGITSSTFHEVPDEPVQSFELALPEGEYSALAANGNLCNERLTMPTMFIAQSGKTFRQSTEVQVQGCSAALAVRSHRVRRGTLSLKVYVPAAGKVKVSGRGVKAQAKTVQARGLTSFEVEAPKTGASKTKVSVVFTPSKGSERKRQVKSVSVSFGGAHAGR